jgi:type IV fimbrial biogenesis protein FimT
MKPLKAKHVQAVGHLRCLRSLRRLQGLTLIELMVTLSIFAILATLAVPSFGARADRSRLQRAAETLAGDISEARFEATRRGQPLFVQSAPSCWTIASTPDCACGAVQACQVHRTEMEQHPGVTLQGDIQLRLEPSGQAERASGVTLRSRRGEQLRVEVSGLGRPRICSPSGGTSAWPRFAACS